MSADNVERISRRIRARIPEIRLEQDGINLLKEQVVALARNSADHVFWKVTNEPGWTMEAATALADEAAKGHGMAIVETLHQFGGTLDMVHGFVGLWLEAYQQWFNELSLAARSGGAA